MVLNQHASGGFRRIPEGPAAGVPPKIEQRIAADQLIAQIEKSLAKPTCDELLEKDGYGRMVVGVPPWFAVPRMPLSGWKTPLTTS